MEPKYPDIHVRLTGEDGNAFAIIARVKLALKRAGVDPLDIEEYRRESMSGDYDNVIQTAMRWVTIH